MYEEQEIWLAPRATGFTAVCDRCLEEQALVGYAGATLSGYLRLEDDHGSAECPRGHRVRIVRAGRALAGVIR